MSILKPSKTSSTRTRHVRVVSRSVKNNKTRTRKDVRVETLHAETRRLRLESLAARIATCTDAAKDVDLPLITRRLALLSAEVKIIAALSPRAAA